MAIKKLIEGQPNFTDRSQYNFDDNETVFDYDNSTGLPSNKDKFTKKDLYTADYGDELNVNSFSTINNLKRDMTVGFEFFKRQKKWLRQVIFDKFSLKKKELKICKTKN